MNHSVAHFAINIWWFEATWFSNKMKSYSAAHAVNKNAQFTQYTLSALLSSFPWTTQKSIIVENSKIVENFGATIFSTIMKFEYI